MEHAVGNQAETVQSQQPRKGGSKMAKLITHIFGRSYESPKSQVQTHIDPGEGHAPHCRCRQYHSG